MNLITVLVSFKQRVGAFPRMGGQLERSVGGRDVDQRRSPPGTKCQGVRQTGLHFR